MLLQRGFGLPGALVHDGADIVPPAPVPLTKLVAEGDSITANADGYAQRWADANPTVPFAREAVGGSTINAGTSMTGRLGATMDEEPSHLTVLIGANDLKDADDAADYAGDIFAYVAAAKAIDPAVIVGVAGVLPIDGARYGSGSYTGFNARRNDLNPLLRAAVGNEIDFYIPLGDALADADATNASLSDDGIHWTTLGYDRMEPVYAAVMDPILAEASGSVPSAFSFTDAANAVAEQVYEASIHVTGLGLGQTATASISGDGTFARGSGSFGTSALTVMNGDVVRVRVEAGADPEDEVAATVSIGGVSDTFTVTTAPAAGVEFVGEGEHYNITRAGSTAVFSFADVYHPGGRPLIFIYKDGAAPTAVTFGGKSCTSLGSETGSGYAYSAWLAPDDEDEGDYAIQVSTGYSTTCDIITCGLANVTSSTATGFTKRNVAYHNSGNVTGEASITVGGGGLRIIMGHSVGARSSYNENTLQHTFSTGLRYGSGTIFLATYTATGTPTFAVASGVAGMIAVGVE